jgi:hypothetical protein
MADTHDRRKEQIQRTDTKSRYKVQTNRQTQTTDANGRYTDTYDRHLADNVSMQGPPKYTMAGAGVSREARLRIWSSNVEKHNVFQGFGI